PAGGSPPPPPADRPTLELLAGTLGGPGNLDGDGPDARLWEPHGNAIDPMGNLYVAGTINDTVRKGTSGGGVPPQAVALKVSGSQDGRGAAALFCNPTSVAVDGLGNVYVADAGNSTIRTIAPSGMVTTVAGMAQVTGTADGTRADARFNFPQGVAVDG